MERFFRGVGWTLAAIVLIGGLLRAFILEQWRIPNDPLLAASIAPTLAGGDLVLLLTRGSVAFGDLVRCKDPENPGSFVVGRVAGLEGDVVEVRGALLTVNGKRYESTSSCKEPFFHVAHPTTGSEVQMACDVVEMGGGWHYRGHMPKASAITKSTKVEVGAGMVFLVSDNRDLHDDSRDFGTVERASCKGPIFFRLVGMGGWGDERRRMTYIR